jgi:hypothetical protein
MWSKRARVVQGKGAQQKWGKVQNCETMGVPTGRPVSQTAWRDHRPPSPIKCGCPVKKHHQPAPYLAGPARAAGHAVWTTPGITLAPPGLGQLASHVLWCVPAAVGIMQQRVCAFTCCFYGCCVQCTHRKVAQLVGRQRSVMCAATVRGEAKD